MHLGTEPQYTEIVPTRQLYAGLQKVYNWGQVPTLSINDVVYTSMGGKRTVLTYYNGTVFEGSAYRTILQAGNAACRLLGTNLNGTPEFSAVVCPTAIHWVTCSATYCKVSSTLTVSLPGITGVAGGAGKLWASSADGLAQCTTEGCNTVLAEALTAVTYSTAQNLVYTGNGNKVFYVEPDTLATRFEWASNITSGAGGKNLPSTGCWLASCSTLTPIPLLLGVYSSAVTAMAVDDEEGLVYVGTDFALDSRFANGSVGRINQLDGTF